MPKKNPPFIVIESLDAAGGSTQLAYLKRHLKKEKYTPHTYHFPQEDRATGQLIYEKYLRGHETYTLSRREQALLYVQDFYSRLEEMQSIRKANDVIISDRYCTSTMAYQTIGYSGVPRINMIDWLKWLCWEGKPQLLKPDHVILLDIPTDIAVERLKNKRKDIHERKDVLDAVRKSYLKLAEDQKWKVVSVVAESGEERTRRDIHDQVWSIIKPLLK